MLAKVAPTFHRWIDHAKNMTLLGAIGAGCIYGYAYAIAPTVDTGREFVGSVNIATTNQSTVAAAYTVPPGRQLTITDVIIAHDSSVPAEAFLWVGSANCDSVVIRLNEVKVPAGETLHLPLVTGIGVGPGKTVCTDANQVSTWTMRGYLTNDT